MELTYVTIVVLASMVFVLSGMVGYVYWQQTRMLQHLQSLALALATHVEMTKQQSPQEEEEEDDRVSVKEEKVELVEGPPKQKEHTPEESPKEKEDTDAKEDDVDDLQDKTATELKDLLTKKGIPFGKRDSKPVLIQLLKATA
jgi:hypothetical protein